MSTATANTIAPFQKQLASDEKKEVEAGERAEATRVKVHEAQRKWAGLLSEFETIGKHLTYAAQQAEDVELISQSLPENCRVNLGHPDGPLSHPLSLANWGATVAGAREALVAIRNWQAEKLEERNRIGEALKAFAKLHGIESHLPAELK